MTDIGDKWEGLGWGCSYGKTDNQLRSFLVHDLGQTLLYVARWSSNDLVGLYNIVDYSPRDYFNGTRSWI